MGAWVVVRFGVVVRRVILDDAVVEEFGSRHVVVVCLCQLCILWLF